jgi:hypothetical protein
MTDGLQRRLDAKLGEFRSAGRKIMLITACAADIEQLFVEGGEGAILLDCDPGRDAAWYGDIELQVSDQPGTRLIVAGEDGPQQVAV